jgi:transcriptional regulator with XRE-family HTH domain
MSDFSDFVERLKKEKDGFAEVWESNRPIREFINHIAKIRVEKGLTQSELAEKAGLHQSAIARFESGDSNPGLKTILKIVGVLDQKLTTTPSSLEQTDSHRKFSYAIGDLNINEDKPDIRYKINWKSSLKKENNCHACEG